MRAPRSRPPIKRAETWLWSGPVGHLVGGALDFAQAIARHLRAKMRGRSAP